MKLFSKNKLIILSIFILAFLLRIYGLNWDDNHHLHPDERFLTMVVSDIKIPLSLSQYFNTATSPLNPYNYSQYQFFVYGTFPIFLTKIVAVLFHLDDYNHITLVGRVLSALFDSGNIILLYFISKKFLKKYYVYLPSFFYTFLVLPLQLSHFFAVDTFLTFFILLTFTLFSYNLFAFAFFAFGLALACKISALYFIPIIFLFLLKKLFRIKNKFSLLPLTIYYSLFTLLAFRIFQPYAFTNIFKMNPLFINNLKTLTNFSSPDIYYPPAVQWINRLPLLNSLANLSIWGFGIPISILFFSLIIIFFKKPKLKFNLTFIICFWILFLYIYQGSQFSHSMRYFLPIYPFICIILAALLKKNKINKFLIVFIFILNIIYVFSFLSIYSKPNSRVEASNWINQNISRDSILSSEYWDDALPLGYSEYKNISLPFFDSDSEEKWEKINQSLDQIDYLIMSSNRLWASIPRVPDKYPQTSEFYKDLFSEILNFRKIKEFNSYPGFSLSFLKSCYYFGPTNYPGIKNTWFSIDENCSYPGIYFRDDTAEEAFTVYDHPKVLIFKKNEIN
ncbi:MAG TPA: hypothetical protein PKI92_00105 [Candidatus Woesebacteria bacterium]|nr:hypothetical protein [Candidatus Woesebacteria bacterium]HPR99726.1 hypothetical protein [Candidatus Woesebacteria bacterium]